MTERWMFVGGPLDGAHATRDWQPPDSWYELPTGDLYEVKRFVDGGGILLYEEPELVLRAPTRPLTPDELAALRELSEARDPRPLVTPSTGPACRSCGTDLLFSARLRADRLCGPCHRKAERGMPHESEVYRERVRAVARWARREHGSPDWARALGAIAGLADVECPIYPRSLFDARAALGEARCAEIYEAYISTAPCVAPCGKASCGLSGSRCQKGCPR